MVFLALTAAGWSGTSTGVSRATQTSAPDPALVAGTLRAVRQDEWNVATPLVVAQSHHGYPRVTADGIGPHDLSVIIDIPNTDWSTAFKPWDVPPLLLDVEHGFAARWWMMSLLLLLGGYLLLLALTDRTDIAVLFSLAIWLSPLFAWWYESIALNAVGLGMWALGALLYAGRASTRPRRVAWLALAAYATVAWVLVLYPPFEVPAGLVLGIVGVSELVSRRRAGEASWARIGADVGAVAVVSGVVLLAYYLHDRSTIHAITGTVYPGKRRLTGGGASLDVLLSAPFGYALAEPGAQLTTTNQSEIASMLLLGPFVALQLFRVGLRSFVSRSRLVLGGTVAAGALAAAWFLVSLPPFLAAVLGLDRVEPPRAVVGIGLAGFLSAAVFLAAGPELPAERPPRDRRQFTRRIVTGALYCAALCFAVYFWGGRAIIEHNPMLGMGLKRAGAFALAAAVVVGLVCARKALLGGLALVAFGAFLTLPVNPLYQGLGDLTGSPLIPVFTGLEQSSTSPSHPYWLSFSGYAVDDVLIASGVPTLNAIDLYPDPSTWRILDPTGRDRQTWDRYANIDFAVAPEGSPPAISLVQADLVRVTIDPCGSAAGRLGVGFVASDTPLAYSCLRQVRTEHPAGHALYLYARSP